MFPATHCQLLRYLSVAIEIAVYHVGFFFFFCQTNLLVSILCVLKVITEEQHTLLLPNVGCFIREPTHVASQISTYYMKIV